MIKAKDDGDRVIWGSLASQPNLIGEPWIHVRDPVIENKVSCA